MPPREYVSIKTMPSRVVELKFSDPSAMFEFLSPTGPLATLNLLYRGQGDSKWQLIPSAFRFNSKLRRKVPTWTNRDQALAEINVIRMFIRRADEQGLQIPGGFDFVDEELQFILNRMDMDIDVDWPTRQLLPAVALAQHYGLPTRLLDWSKNPYTALYFAISDVMKKDIGGNFAIWIAFANAGFGESTDTTAFDLELSKPGYYGNDNLRAQSGFFMLPKLPRQPNRLFDCPSLEAIAAECADINGRPKYPEFIKLVLPCRYAPMMLDNLEKVGISASTLYPGFGGAAESVRQRLGVQAPNADLGNSAYPHSVMSPRWREFMGDLARVSTFPGR